jgi:hypothetical protein
MRETEFQIAGSGYIEFPGSNQFNEEETCP